MSDYNLKNKVVIVTGAGTGVGEATAIEFAKHGSRVVLVDKDEENVKRVASICEQVSQTHHSALQAQHLVVVGDLTAENVCEEIVNKAIEKYNGVDVLVNNAGIATIRNIFAEDFLENFDHVMNVNARVPLKLSRLCLPHLVTSKGCIVNISSVGSFVGAGYDTVHYSMSKAALDAMTRLLAFNFGPQGVRAVTINPAVIATNVHGRMDYPQEFIDKLVSKCPLRRPAQPTEIATAVCFAASSAASYITGSNILLDGGYALNS